MLNSRIQKFQQKNPLSEAGQNWNGLYDSDLNWVVFEVLFGEDVFADIDDATGEDLLAGVGEQAFEGEDVAVNHIEIRVLERAFDFVVDLLQPFLLKKYLSFPLADLFDTFIQEIKAFFTDLKTTVPKEKLGKYNYY